LVGTTADSKKFDKIVADMMVADKMKTLGMANTEKAIDMERPGWTNTTQVAETGIAMPADRMQVERGKMKTTNWLGIVPTASVDAMVNMELGCNPVAETTVDSEPIASADNTNCPMNMMAENMLADCKWVADNTAEIVNMMAADRTVDKSEEDMSVAHKWVADMSAAGRSAADMSAADRSVVDMSAARRFAVGGTSVEHKSVEDNWVVGIVAADKTVAGNKLVVHTSGDKKAVDTREAGTKGADRMVDKTADMKGDTTATDRVPVDKMMADKMLVADKTMTDTEEISSHASIPQRH
jgi:hypothetical protein